MIDYASCYLDTGEIITWPSIDSLDPAQIGAFAPYVGAHDHGAGAMPLRPATHRWCRDARVASGAADLVSWNTRGLLGAPQPQPKIREKENSHVRPCSSVEAFVLQHELTHAGRDHISSSETSENASRTWPPKPSPTVTLAELPFFGHSFHTPWRLCDQVTRGKMLLTLSCVSYLG